MNNNARDVDYFGGDNEVDYQQHARSAQVSQKFQIYLSIFYLLVLDVEDGFEDDENENEGNDFMTLDDVPDVQDEDIEEMLYENNEDDIQGDSEDDIDDTDDELVEEQIEGLPSQKARELSITKKRGPTMMHGVQVRNFNDREAIICNEFGQPIGPVTEEKDTKRCSLKKDARMSQKNMHTAGPKSFARIREEMINDDPNKEPPTLAQMFERTRKRTPGNKYIDTYDDTAKKIEQMKNYKPSEDGSTSVDPFLAIMGKEYDGHRRLYGKGVTNRLINKVSGNDTSYMLPREITDSLRENVEKDHLLDMRKKLEVEHATKKAEIEENHARKKAELQEDHARNKAELEALRNDIDKVVDAKMQEIIEKLPPSIAQFLM
ncbi:hypothetical protein LXL04_014532 [Taraxacum kok-saghyz]